MAMQDERPNTHQVMGKAGARSGEEKASLR
jgi:hypothetical protein